MATNAAKQTQAGGQLAGKPADKKAAAPRMFTVLDTTAKDPNKPRVHSPGNDEHGVPIEYEFPYNKKVAMPFRHAMKFLQVPTFKVWDDEGKLLEAVRATSDGSGSGMTLKPHETIATYAELSLDALAARCKRLPNGASITSKTPRSIMIDFLMSGGMPLVQKVGEAEDEDTEEDLIDNDGDDGDGDANLAGGILDE